MRGTSRPSKVRAFPYSTFPAHVSKVGEWVVRVCVKCHCSSFVRLARTKGTLTPLQTTYAKLGCYAFKPVLIAALRREFHDTGVVWLDSGVLLDNRVRAMARGGCGNAKSIDPDGRMPGRSPLPISLPPNASCSSIVPGS